MSIQTPPMLTGVIDLAAGEGVVLSCYQGIRFTMIPLGGDISYSKVDEPDATAHDPTTVIVVSLETVIDVDWPWYYVTCDTGTARVALI